MSKATVEITDNNFDHEVLKSGQPVLVDFWAEWCGPCKAIAPFVEQIATEYTGKLKVGKLDTDQYGDVAQRYGIMGIPTLILFKNGEVATRITGYQPKEELVKKLSPHL
ncbi:MAG: thioredoxin [Chloroflexota bacterium]|jgi:thioredoxin 1|nr:thioredoxin [Chloroflexota bacterium]